MKQADMVMWYITQFGSITPIDAFEDLGITRLSAVVFDLKEKGVNIITDIEHGKNRYGKPTRYARYSFGGNDED